ncbi:MAG: ABC-F family ATP-binding cassette domain-containing protein [Bacteroidales bacterium]|nr:ABC-F family ATP-binding cassette domain-containing protein [Bacteroidales bacterium]
MNYLLIEQLSKSYGEKELFSDITFGIDQGSKVALIARNGAGKSSLLNIITGKDLPDSGAVTFRKGIRWSYLPQNPLMDDSKSVFEVLFHADNEFMRAIRDYELSLVRLRHEDTPDAHHQLEISTNAMEMVGGWDYEVKIREILSRFKITDLEQKTGELSGGQRKKLSLAKALIEETDLLILDEPTNHLDIEMIEWLEEYLSRQNLSLLVVTHDRYFLDNVCNEILELDNNKLYRYKGNYSYFLEKKAEREVIEQTETEKARGMFRKELEWMRRMPQARTTKSKARIENFYDIQEKASKRLEKDTGPLEVKMTRIGGKVLEMNNVFKSFGDNKLIDSFSYIFKKGERVGVIGRNGSGKSTLLNMITGGLSPDMGRISAGQTIVFGYYSQEGFLPAEDKRVIDLAKDIAEEMPLGKGRITASAFLAHFNFPHTLQYNYFSSLSGGEKRRLFLLMQLLKNPNFLILDEPTNDLDIHTLNLLEDFLMNFGGCLLVVSHDRFFMDKLVDHVFVFEGNGKVKDYYGNYTDYYRIKLAEEAKAARQKPVASTKPVKEVTSDNKSRKPSYKEKTEFEKLEVDIAALETEKEALLQRMNSGTCSPSDFEDVARNFSKIEQLISEKTDRWLELSVLFE